MVKLNPKKTVTNTQPPVHWSFWLGLSFFVVVIIGLISFCWFISLRVNADEAVPVTSIALSGEMPYTTSADIEQAMTAINLNNFFAVDVNQVQKVLAQLPWVYRVSVRKQWPNELKVYVVDQAPVAIWNGDFLLNQQGDAFQADQQRLVTPLPAFYGPEGSEHIALDNFHDINKLLSFSQLSIDELVLNERFAWQLTLSDGIKLNLGRENRIERIQRFMDLYPEIIRHQKVDQRVDYVDLRYDTGLAVGWQPVVQQDKKRA